jgi:subtilase family serine protease
LDFTCTEGSVTANVDPDDQVAESDEQNNARTVTGLTCPKPDLIITVLTRSSVTVMNQGDADAGPFEIRVTGLQATLKVASLAAGASVRLDFGACLDGTFTATADSSKTVDESNENNNSATENNLSCID